MDLETLEAFHSHQVLLVLLILGVRFSTCDRLATFTLNSCNITVCTFLVKQHVSQHKNGSKCIIIVKNNNNNNDNGGWNEMHLANAQFMQLFMMSESMKLTFKSNITKLCDWVRLFESRLLTVRQSFTTSYMLGRACQYYGFVHTYHR